MIKMFYVRKGHIMKYMLVVLLFFAAYLPLFGQKIIVFERPQANSRTLIADKNLFHPTGKTVKMIVEEHPLVYIHDTVELKTSGGLVGYQRHDLHVAEDGRRVVRKAEIPPFPMTMLIAALLFSGALIFDAFRSKVTVWHCMAVPILVRIILLSAVLCKWDGVYTIAADETGYFQTVSDLLKGELRTPWRFTVGTGLFYLPWVKLLNAQKFYDIIEYFNLFNAYVFAPSVLAAGFLILRKLGVSAGKSCLTILVWAVFPFVAFHIEDWNIWQFQHIFLFPQLFAEFQRLVFYGFCINSGFNGMSDMPGLMIVMWSLYLALAMPAKVRWALLFGALYGFACLVRINYILLAPAFALVLFHKFRSDMKVLLCAGAGSVGAFLAVFSFQMICNFLQFGNPLTFGYILHYTENNVLDRPAAGFTWHTFSRLTFTRYLLQSNLPVLAIGGAALWVNDRTLVRRILVIFGVPLLLFFCGYSHTFCDARRFIFPTFAAFLFAIPAAKNIWNKLSKLEITMIFVVLAAMILVTTPVDAYWKDLPLKIGKGVFLSAMAVAVPAAMLALLAFLLKRRHVPAAIFILLCGVFYYLPSLVLGTALLLLLLWSAGLDMAALKLKEKICRQTP